MMKNVASIAFALLLTSLAGCTFDPVGSCQSQCAAAKRNGCEPEVTDCVALCEDARTEFDASRAVAAEHTCAGEFDNYRVCLATEDPCAPDICTPELDRLFRCTDAYCEAHPEDLDCP